MQTLNIQMQQQSSASNPAPSAPKTGTKAGSVMAMGGSKLPMIIGVIVVIVIIAVAALALTGSSGKSTATSTSAGTTAATTTSGGTQSGSPSPAL